MGHRVHPAPAQGVAAQDAADGHKTSPKPAKPPQGGRRVGGAAGDKPAGGGGLQGGKALLVKADRGQKQPLPKAGGVLPVPFRGALALAQGFSWGFSFVGEGAVSFFNWAAIAARTCCIFAPVVLALATKMKSQP